MAMSDLSRTQESDAFFKYVPPDWYENDSCSGNVECNTGAFGLLRIDADFRNAWDHGEYSIPASVEDGLYLVVVDSNGLVWALAGDNEDETLVDFRDRQEQYSVWLEIENAEDEQAWHDRHGL